MMLDRAGIETCVPHAGAMCLLDAVTRWDALHIACSAAAPQAHHPLARGGMVPAVVVVEYAAQATAVHGTLLDSRAAPRGGMLATLNDVELHCHGIALGEGPLAVQAELVSRSAAACLYAFDVATSRRRIVSGCLMVAFTP
jgi:predicted hotdog family 3-hydroxylacyl-ACP dehydratase